MADLIRPNGTVEQVEPENGTDFNLEELYKAIGCSYVQVVYLTCGKLMIVDEEGQVTGKELNRKASLLAGTAIVGNAVMCEREQLK